MPAVLLGQFRIFRDGGRPLGFATWAFLSDKLDRSCAAAFEHGQPLNLGLADWKSGPHPWLIEFVAPLATPENKLKEALLKQIEVSVFQHRPFKRAYSTARVVSLC